MGGVLSTSQAAKRFIGIRVGPSPLAVLLVTTLPANDPRPILSVIFPKVNSKAEIALDCYRMRHTKVQKKITERVARVSVRNPFETTKANFDGVEDVTLINGQLSSLLPPPTPLDAL